MITLYVLVPCWKNGDVHFDEFEMEFCLAKAFVFSIPQLYLSISLITTQRRRRNKKRKRENKT